MPRTSPLRSPGTATSPSASPSSPAYEFPGAKSSARWRGGNRGAVGRTGAPRKNGKAIGSPRASSPSFVFRWIGIRSRNVGTDTTAGTEEIQQPGAGNRVTSPFFGGAPGFTFIGLSQLTAPRMFPYSPKDRRNRDCFFPGSFSLSGSLRRRESKRSRLARVLSWPFIPRKKA